MKFLIIHLNGGNMEKFRVCFFNVEFYTTPKGDVGYLNNGNLFLLKENDYDFIDWFIDKLKAHYSNAYLRLKEIYSTNSRNKSYYKFCIVRRFIKCNFGELDEFRQDINDSGNFNFEEVKCPLRGECKDEGVICFAQFSSGLSAREMQVLYLVSNGYKNDDIADMLFISTCTVNRHKENIKKKLNLKSVVDMVIFYNNNLFNGKR